MRSGSFDMNDPENKQKVGTAIVGKAACGDVIKLQVIGRTSAALHPPVP